MLFHLFKHLNFGHLILCEILMSKQSSQVRVYSNVLELGVTYTLYVTRASVHFTYLGGIATPGGTLKQSPCACLGP